MKHRIDPRVDCVFKSLLGSIENRNLLIHFLNAFLGDELAAPIEEVDLLNPYNEKEMLDDKINIVDVKALDEQGNWYQIEIQLLNHRHLVTRMVYTWADLYSQQLKSGQKYSLLRPTYSIWILANDLLKNDELYLHDYQWRDTYGNRLAQLGGIWLVELNKFRTNRVDNEQLRWLSFLQQGEDLDETNLPYWMITPEMEQAMATLERFSEKERDYHAYQARQNYLRVQYDIEEEREELQQENQQLQQNNQQLEQNNQQLEQNNQQLEQNNQQLEQNNQQLEQNNQQLRQETELALQREKQALDELGRLKALLNKSGVK